MEVESAEETSIVDKMNTAFDRMKYTRILAATEHQSRPGEVVNQYQNEDLNAMEIETDDSIRETSREPREKKRRSLGRPAESSRGKSYDNRFWDGFSKQSFQSK